jgi:membrane-bound metal-dependent hydrolase YbcI (DUF457 family)
MTPLGHGAVAYTCSALHRRLRTRDVALALVVGGVVPDIDFVMVWSPGFNAWHRVVTHNVFFVALVAVGGAVVARWRGWPRAIAWALALGGALHLLVDSVMDGNPSNGIGVAAWWPLSDRMVSPFNLVRIAEDPPTWRELDRMIPAVLSSMVLEAPWVVVAAVLWRRRSKRTAGRAVTDGAGRA